MSLERFHLLSFGPARVEGVFAYRPPSGEGLVPDRMFAYVRPLGEGPFHGRIEIWNPTSEKETDATIEIAENVATPSGRKARHLATVAFNGVAGPSKTIRRDITIDPFPTPPVWLVFTYYDSAGGEPVIITTYIP